MNNQYSLHYGTNKVSFDLPFDNVVYGSPGLKHSGTTDLQSMVQDSLSNMTGYVNLQSLSPNARVVIVCDDYTRPTPAASILPVLVEYLLAKGIVKENISILVAAGFHREMTAEEKIKKYGEYICQNFRIYHHDSLDNDNLCCLGSTSFGVPVYVNKLAVQADFLIGIGTVEIHPWAGFSGGNKIICPGIAGKKTINYSHALPITKENVGLGITHGNPFWESAVEASKMAGLDMVINVVLDDEEKVCSLFCGEAEAVQEKCIAFFKSCNEILFEEPADIVITSANPKHQYWGQAATSGFNAARVVKDGGTRIVLAECREGFGDSQQEIIYYFDSLKSDWKNLDNFWKEKQGIELDNSRNAAPVYTHLKLLQKSDMLLVTRGLPSTTPPMASQKVAASLEEALKIVYVKYGKHAKVNIFDMGAMFLAGLRE